MKISPLPHHLGPFAEAVWPHFVAMLNEMSFSFILKPHAACCGKPIVFPHPHRIFKCGRCEKTYKLVVEIKEISK